METLLQVPQGDRLLLGEDKVQRLAEAWAFFDTVFAVCERDEVAAEGQQCSTCQAKRPARQPVVGKPQVEPVADADEEDTTQHLVGAWPRGEARRCGWLEEHAEVVQTVMTPHVDALRLALDSVGSQLNAGGVALDEALGRDEACEALRCFVANLQVWGSLPTSREMEEQPERLASQHRQLARVQVAHARRVFRQHLASLRRTLEPLARDDGLQPSALCAAVLSHLREIEGFVSLLYRFFKCATGPTDLLSVDAPASDDCEEASRPPRPVLDRSVTGYVMCVDCGHNGVLSESELQHLALHLRAARFGKYGRSCSLGA